MLEQICNLTMLGQTAISMFCRQVPAALGNGATQPAKCKRRGRGEGKLLFCRHEDKVLASLCAAQASGCSGAMGGASAALTSQKSPFLGSLGDCQPWREEG